MTSVQSGATVPPRAITAGSGRHAHGSAWPCFGCHAHGFAWACATHLLPLCFAIISAFHPAVPAAAEPSAPTSDRAVRNEALRAIPWRQIAPQHRRAAQHVVNDASIYRRLPTRVIDCDPDMFSFLVQHPEVVIDVWRVMGLSQVALERLPNGAGAMPTALRGHADQIIHPPVSGTGPVYRGTDGAGTTGTVRFLFCDWGPNAHNLAVIYADGAYEGKPFVTPIKAQSVLLLRSGAIQETNGRHYVTVRVDSFVRIEQVGIELVAKTIQPWIAKTADYNFIETLTFVSNFSRTAERNPSGIERLATRLDSVDEPTRQALVAISRRTAERYAALDSAGRAAPSLVAQRAIPEITDAEWIGPLPATPLAR